jgi:polyisoprenoid-binding protein YceI
MENHPEAFFAITNSTFINETNYRITGDLTIKGIKHPVSFPATVTINDNKITASGKIIVDRTKYEMKFRSGNFFTNLGDTLIYNEFELDVKLIATL